MDKSKIVEEYRILLATKLRKYEVRKSQGDQAKLQELADTTDAMLLRKWMWRIAIAGGPLCFLVVPLVLSVLTPFVWQPLMMVLWTVARIAMGIVFITFLLAIYFTTNQTSN